MTRRVRERSMRGPARWALAVCLAAGVASADDFGLAARVNGRPITQERLDRYFEDRALEKGRDPNAIWNPTAFKKLKREALDSLVEQELLWQEAERKKALAGEDEARAAVEALKTGYKSPEAFRRRLARGGFDDRSYTEYMRRQLSIRKLLDQEIAAARIAVTDEEARERYEARPDLYTEPEQVHVRHILVKVEAGAAPAVREKARKQAERIRALARKKGADFGALAMKHSQDATAPGGGDLGFISRSQMVPPFEAAAFALAPGEVSGVVETFFGFHVVKAEARRGGNRIPEPEAREQIKKKIFAEKAERILQEKVAALKASGRVEVLLAL